MKNRAAVKNGSVSAAIYDQRGPAQPMAIAQALDGLVERSESRIDARAGRFFVGLFKRCRVNHSYPQGAQTGTPAALAFRFMSAVPDPPGMARQ